MSQQLNIPFPKHVFDMETVKLSMLQAELDKCQQVIQKQKNTIKTYKGHFTKKNKKHE